MKVLRGFPPSARGLGSAPYFLGIHLQPICNFRCKKCFIGEQKRLKNLHPTLSTNEISAILKSAKRAGAKVLGPIKIGDGAKIGANSVVLKDVPTGATAVGRRAKNISKIPEKSKIIEIKDRQGKIRTIYNEMVI